MRYWFCSSRMLSRMRTLGRMMPMSAATFCRTRWIRSSRSPPRWDRPGESAPRRSPPPWDRRPGSPRPAASARFRRVGLLFGLVGRLGLMLARDSVTASADATGRRSATAESRQAGEDQDAQKTARHRQRLRTRKKLPEELRRQVAVVAAAGDQQAGGQGDQEGRHLRHQAVADGQLGEQRSRRRPRSCPP